MHQAALVGVHVVDDGDRRLVAAHRLLGANGGATVDPLVGADGRLAAGGLLVGERPASHGEGGHPPSPKAMADKTESGLRVTSKSKTVLHSGAVFDLERQNKEWRWIPSRLQVGGKTTWQWFRLSGESDAFIHPHLNFILYHRAKNATHDVHNSFDF